MQSERVRHMLLGLITHLEQCSKQGNELYAELVQFAALIEKSVHLDVLSGQARDFHRRVTFSVGATQAMERARIAIDNGKVDAAEYAVLEASAHVSEAVRKAVSFQADTLEKACRLVKE